MDSYVFYVKTERAKFRIKFSKNKGIRLNENGGSEPLLLGYIVTIGGERKPDCLQINVPLEGDTGHLMWLEASSGCSLDVEIKGDLTIHMAHLGFSIARHINPHLQYLHLQDSADFVCELPDGKSYAINMTDHDLAFYQQTYYEKRYKAKFVSKDLQREYEALRPHFEDPAKKPAVFDFLVPALNEVLTPIYLKADTWKDFFKAIADEYKQKKCQVIYPWIKHALSHIFEHRSFSGQPMILDMDGSPSISYHRIQKGGVTETRRRGKRHTYRHASPPELASMNWASVLRAYGVRKD